MPSAQRNKSKGTEPERTRLGVVGCRRVDARQLSAVAGGRDRRGVLTDDDPHGWQHYCCVQFVSCASSHVSHPLSPTIYYSRVVCAILCPAPLKSTSGKSVETHIN